MTDEEPKAKSTGLSTRGAVLAGVGVVVILVLALFAGVVLVPFLQTRAVLRSGRNVVERLGGPERAAERLISYLRWPDWAAPDKDEAVDCLALCGDAAARPLFRAINEPNPAMRRRAASALGGQVLRGTWTDRGRTHELVARSGVNPTDAVPVLEQALRDEDASVRAEAAKALEKIRKAEKTKARKEWPIKPDPPYR